jgi:uncharacterized membrane protein
VELYIWVISLAFSLPVILYWRKAFIAFLVLIGAPLSFGWLSYFFWISPGDLNAGGSLGVAAIFVITLALGLGTLLRVLVYPLVSEIHSKFTMKFDAKEHTVRMLNWLRAAAAGFVLGTFGWLVAAQMKDITGTWLLISVSAMLASVVVYSVTKALVSFSHAQSNPDRS